MQSFFIFISLLFLPILTFGQSSVEKLTLQLKSVSGKERVDLLNKLSSEILNSDPKKSFDYAVEAKTIALKENYKEGYANALLNAGSGDYYLDEFVRGIDTIKKALRIYHDLNLIEKEGIANGMIGEIYTYTGQYKESLEYLLNAKRILEKYNNPAELARCNNNIGKIHKIQRNYEEALLYFQNGFDFGDDIRKGDAALMMGQVYFFQKKYTDADKYLKKAIYYAIKNEDKYVLADAFAGLGDVNSYYGNKDTALQYFNQALEIKKEVDDEQGTAYVCNGIGNLYLQNSNTVEAHKFYKKALDIAKRLDIRDELKTAYLGISNTFHLTKRDDSAYIYLDKYNIINTELISDEASKKLRQIEETLASEKRKQTAEKEKYKANIIKAFSAGIIVVLFIILYILYNRYKLKQKAHIEITKQKEAIVEQRDLILEQNEELLQSKEEIRTQMEELEQQSTFLMKQGDKIDAQNRKIKEQMALVNQQKKEIMDSIHYAKRIQTAILPPDEYMSTYLKDYFILYKPKDIVSGDFYWIEEIENKILFAAVDCTGHGVPGAFMSIVGNNGLDRAVREQKMMHPCKILDVLDDFVVETLRQANKTEVKDGMDIALCAYDLKTKDFEFSGANNPLYLIRKKPHTLSICDKEYLPCMEFEDYQLFEIKGDKQPIGAIDDRKEFMNHVFKTVEGDSVYVFTDGYADQFGGPKGKKFKYAQLKELLLKICHEPMSTQKQILDDALVAWKQDLEQVDDITIMGIKIE